MRKSKLVVLTLISTLLIASGTYLLLNKTQSTNAADFSKFNAGNIMSDYVMSNKNSMSEADISNFIRSKITCNRPYDATIKYYESLGYQYHIKNGYVVCIADEYEWFGNKTAANIIYNAAQDYSINPQVLLVLIQKEQGLLSDNWPNSRQYASATGYGCPDTAACDSSYSGFEKQVRSAATLYREVLNGGWTNYPVGWNYIQYNPNKNCGGSNVYIENRATSALYRFTPYQPNAATLSVGMGIVADSACGAYGNKNFYGYFTDWFGNTQGNRWSNMIYPRLMVAETATCKVNPDTLETYCEGSGRISVNQDVNFSTSTTLANGDQCLRTAFDTNQNNNKCVLIKRLKEVPRTYEVPSVIEANQVAKQFTCKVILRNLEAQCDKDWPLTTNLVLQFAQKVTVLDQVYYVTKADWRDGAFKEFELRGVMQERFTSVPSYTAISQDSVLQHNIQYTCKIYLPSKTITNQCFAANTNITFAEMVEYDGVEYIRTANDTKNNNGMVFIAARFSK